jgi:hypothetical protein
MLAVIGLFVGLAWTLSAMMAAYLARPELHDEWSRVDDITFRAWHLLYWAGIILFVVWIYRAARDARALRPKHKVMSPGMCALSFFIPVANLFLPYKAMFEITAASDSGGEGRVPMFVLAWWLLYLTSWIANYVRSVGIGRGGFGLMGFALDLAVDVLLTCAFVALVLTVRFITRGQEHWAREARPA